MLEWVVFADCVQRHRAWLAEAIGSLEWMTGYAMLFGGLDCWTIPEVSTYSEHSTLLFSPMLILQEDTDVFACHGILFS